MNNWSLWGQYGISTVRLVFHSLGCGECCVWRKGEDPTPFSLQQSILVPAGHISHSRAWFSTRCSEVCALPLEAKRPLSRCTCSVATHRNEACMCKNASLSSKHWGGTQLRPEECVVRLSTGEILHPGRSRGFHNLEDLEDTFCHGPSALFPPALEHKDHYEIKTRMDVFCHIFFWKGNSGSSGSLGFCKTPESKRKKTA